MQLKDCEKKDKYLDLLGEEKTMKHEGDRYTNRDWCFWCSQRKINKGTGGLGNRKKSGDNTNYNIIENGQNAEKSPGDLRTLVPADHRIKLKDCEKKDKYLDCLGDRKNYGT